MAGIVDSSEAENKSGNMINVVLWKVVLVPKKEAFDYFLVLTSTIV